MPPTVALQSWLFGQLTEHSERDYLRFEANVHNDPLRQVDSEFTTELDTPPLFLVLMHNDDYTTMDFVVTILEQVFFKSPAEATHTMLQIHRNGVGICGEYPHQIAESKVTKVHRIARERGLPLRCSVEQV